jgi:hypothetical protein
MPPIGKDDPMGCLLCPTPHSFSESLREGQPMVIILSDQTFPPALPPTGDGNCTVIIQAEDCELWELEEVFTDRFKAFCKPHGNLPSGSVILVGSMSHLAKNGLNFYAPILVETLTRMAFRVGPGDWSQCDPSTPDSGGRNRLGDPAAGHDGPGLLDHIHWSWVGHWPA